MPRIILALISLLVVSPAFSSIFEIPQHADVVGEVLIVTAKPNQTLESIANEYDLGWNEMLTANPNLRGKKLRPGMQVVVPNEFILPRKRQGIVINIPELRLYYFGEDGQYVYTFPVALGRRGWRTPTSKTYVRKKVEEPTWRVPASIQEYTLAKHGRFLPNKVKPGEKNPLGDYALYLGLHGYLIHGTNAPTKIGKFVSSGCVRMYNFDIKTLFGLAKRGTLVYIVHHPDKVGWRAEDLYLESHQSVSSETNRTQLNHTEAVSLIKEVKNRYPALSIDWRKVTLVSRQHNGIPTVIGSASN